jgi:polysaccharide pyruvyl transferase WcaK-like protein
VKVLEQLLEDERVSVTFLPFHLPADEKASLEIIEKIDSRFRPRIHMRSDVNPRLMLAYTDRAGLLIGMRLHALIYAANRAVPMVGISYDPKIDRFLDRLNMKASASTEHFDVRAMVAEARRLLQDATSWQQEKQPIIQQLKQESLIPARNIAAFYKNKG